MKAVFFLLANPDQLQDLIRELNACGITGGTIYESKGLGREMAKNNNNHMITGLLRAFLNPELTTTSTMLFIMEESKIPVLRGCIQKVVGDISKPNTGLLFSIPIDYVEGLKSYD